MYKKIFVAIDNSPYSNYCIDLGIKISQKFGSHLLGCHVYDATLHQRRFRDMEKGLPPQYQDEKVLQRQRDLHTSLINMGLRLISESYLNVFEEKCNHARVSHEELLLEGKNYYEIIKEVQRGGYDLVILGALGLAAVNDHVIGSVCERVVKSIKTDVLVVKNERMDGKVVLAADGSVPSVSGVAPAVALARAFNLSLNAVSVFDPHYHRVAFESIAKVLSKEAGQIFRFKDQETLHEEIIDKGLAKIYQNHLDQVCCMVKDSGLEVNTTLMDGKPYDQILKYLYKESPSLLVLGRTGIHNTHGLDLGSTTVNLLRLAPCNILITKGNTEVKTGSSLFFSEVGKSTNKETQSKRTGKESNLRLSELLTWTEEAQQQTERIPSFIRGVVRKKIEEYAVGKGYQEITTEVVNEAKAGLVADDSSHHRV